MDFYLFYSLLLFFSTTLRLKLFGSTFFFRICLGRRWHPQYVKTVFLLFCDTHFPVGTLPTCRKPRSDRQRVQYCCLSYSWWASELQDSQPKTDWCKAEPLCRKAELGWWNAAFKNQQPFSALCHHGGHTDISSERQICLCFENSFMHSA